MPVMMVGSLIRDTTLCHCTSMGRLSSGGSVAPSKLRNVRSQVTFNCKIMFLLVIWSIPTKNGVFSSRLRQTFNFICKDSKLKLSLEDLTAISLVTPWTAFSSVTLNWEKKLHKTMKSFNYVE